MKTLDWITVGCIIFSIVVMCWCLAHGLFVLALLNAGAALFNIHILYTNLKQ